ncbi:MAG: methionine--tRNA ligase [Candidatus Micrarchaeia archaeon]|jgi:methionyl-tRNA synthetase
MRKILITSALPYANGPLHLGHIMSTYLPADTYARFCRMKGYDAVYVCATDEHGTPIELNAAKAGQPPEEFVKVWRKKHADDFAKAGIRFDEFYHTHSPESEELANLFFKEHTAKGVIYKKTVLQTFCPKCVRFLPDRYVRGVCPHCQAPEQYGDGCEKCGKVYQTTQLTSPKCAICGTTPVQKDTEHYFFKLHHFEEFLKKWFAENKHLQPDVTNYLKNWIEGGLQDWDITRDGPYFGIKIPGEKDKYFYVWYDAPIGYIASSKHFFDTHGKSWESYWKNEKCELVHFIGKDIIYHHFLFWPAMLQSAGFSLPLRIPTRGHATLQGQKMSKSRGTLIGLEEFLAKYPADYLRYYFTAITPASTGDADFSWKEFQSKINNELVDSYGNFCYRVLSFAKTKFGGIVPQPGPQTSADSEFSKKLDQFPRTVEGELEEIRLKEALEKIMLFSAECNKYFNDRAPWKLVKEGKNAEAGTVIYNGVKAAYSLALHMYPFLPFSSMAVFKQLGVPEGAKTKWGDVSTLKPGQKLGEPSIPFAKLEDEAIEREIREVEEKNRA